MKFVYRLLIQLWRSSLILGNDWTVFGVIGPLGIKKKRKDGLQKWDNFSVFIIIIWCTWKCCQNTCKFKGLCQPSIDSNVIYTGNIRVH